MADDQGKSTLTIELDTRQAKKNAHDFAVQLTNVDEALRKIDNKLQNSKNWKMKIDMVMNPINVIDEFNKIQRVLKQSNQKIKIDAELKNIGARNEIAKVQSAVNKTNQKISLDVKLNTQNVKSELGKVQQQVSAASGKIQISVDTSSAKASASALTAEMKTAMESISKAATALTNHLEAENQKRLADNKKANEAIVANNKRSATDSQNIASKMAASVVSMKPIEDSMKLERTLRESSLAETRRIEAQKAKEAQKAAQEMVKGYVDAYAAINRQVQASASTTRAAMEQTFKSFASQRKFTPEVKQATFQSKDTASFADIKAIQSESQQVQKAWRDMYAGVQLEAKNNLAATKTLTNAAIADIKTQTQAKIDAIKQESALSASERKNAITSIQASSKAIIDSMRSIPEAAKGSWSGVMDSSKAAMNAGIAAAKATETAQITGFKNVEAAKRASDKAIEEADNAVLSNLEARLRRSSAAAKAMVDEFARLQGLGNYEQVKNLETSLDKLRAGFANIKFGDNTSQLNGIQDRLNSTYQKAADAAKAYSENRIADAQRLVAETKNEIATLEALRKQILSTGATATTSLSGKSFMSESLKQAGDQVEVLASRLRELGSFTRFDAVTALKSQIDGVYASVLKIPNIGSADLVKALDLIAAGYRNIEQASIASSKGQGFAYMSQMADANKALEKVKQLETELNRFSTAKVQTSQLSAAFEADAKKAIASAKEVGKIKMSVFDDEINKGRQAISERNRLDSNYMRAFEASATQKRAIHKASVDQQTRDTIAAVKAQNAAYQRRVDRISRMDESRVGTVEARNAVLSRTVSGGAYSNIQGTQTAGVAQATEQTIRQHGVLQNIISETSRAHARAMAANVSSTLMWIRNLWLVQQAFQMIGSAMQGLKSGFDRIKDVALTSQKMVTVMSVITGSTQTAREEVEWLRKESDRLGLSFEAAATPFAKFAAAAKGMFDPSMLHEMFTQLGKVSVAMHLDQVETKGVFLAIQQMASKGKVSLEELRLQFAERIPGAMTLAADSMDMTMTQFVKSVSNGQMMTQDFLPKFLTNLESAFGQAADIASRSLTGSLARLENSMFAMWEKIGQGGLAESIRRVADKYAAFVKDNTKLFEQLGMKAGEVFETLADKLLSVISNETAQQDFLGFIDTAKNGFITLASILERVANLLLTIDKFTTVNVNPANHPIVEAMSLPYQALKQATGANTAPDYIPSVDKGVLVTDAKGKTTVKEYAQSLRDEKTKRAFMETQEDISKLNQTFVESSTKVRKFSTDYNGAMRDIQQAGEAALKPKFYSEHMEALDNYVAQIKKAEAELKSLGEANAPSVFKKSPQDLSTFRAPDTSWPTTALLGSNDALAGYGAISKAQKDSTYDREQQINAITTAITKLNEARSKKSLGSDDYTILSNQIDVLTKEGNALKQAEVDAKTAIDKHKGELLDSTTGMIKEFKYVQAELTETTDKFAALGEEIAKIQSKKIDFEAMTPSQLSTSIDSLGKSTSEAAPRLADYQSRMDAIKNIQKDLDAQMAENPGSVELRGAYNAITQAAAATRDEINNGMDTFKRQSSELDRATKAMDAYTEQMYKAKTYMSEMRQLQANKGQVDQLSKQGDISGLTAIMNKAGGSVAPLTEQLLKAKQLEEQTKGNLLEHNKAIETRIGLENSLQGAINQQKDAADAILQLEKKTSEAKQDQYQTELRILNLREKFKAKTDFGAMTRKELESYKEEFTPTKLSLSKIGVTVDTDDLKAQIEGVAPVKVKAEKLDLSEIIRDAAKMYNVPEALIRAVAKTESGFNPKAESTKGARGVMQLMAPTAASYGVTDRDDPRQSIMGGTAFLKDLLKKYKGNISLAAAAYNAGEPRVDKAKGIPNIKETQNYVKLVTAEYDKLQGTVSQPIKIDVDSSGVVSASEDVTQLLHIVKGKTEKMSLFDQIVDQAGQLRETLGRIDQIEANAKGRDYTKQETVERKALVTVLESQSSILDKDLAKLNELNKAWDAQNLKIWENAHAREMANTLAKDSQKLEDLTRYKGLNALPALDTLYTGNQYKLADLRQQEAELTSKLKDVTSADVQKGGEILNLQERNRITDELSKTQAEINRLDTQDNDIIQKGNDLRRQQNQILQDQKDTLRDLTLTNKFGKAGAEYEKMKEFLTPEAFDEWNTDRQQLEIQQFVDAAGLGADSIASSFTNAFSQILVDGASFTDTMKNMFKDMTNRIMNESINLIAKNLMSLGSGGSWAQIGLGVVGVGVGLLGQLASKKPSVSEVNPANKNTNIYGGAAFQQADTSARDTYIGMMTETAQRFNSAVNSTLTLLKNNSTKIWELSETYMGEFFQNFSSSYVGELVTSITKPLGQIMDSVTTFGSNLVDTGISIGSNMLSGFLGTATALTPAILSAYATNAPATVGSLAMSTNGVVSASGAMGKLGMSGASEFGSYGASATGSAATGSVDTVSSMQMVGMALSMVKLGFDLAAIAAEKYSTTMEKVTEGMKAAEMAALSVPVAGWVAAAVLHVVSGVMQVVSGDLMGGISYLLGGHLGEMIAKAFVPDPSATLLSYTKMNPESQWDKEGKYFTSKGPQSASVGVQTPFGYVDARYNDVGRMVKSEDTKNSFQWLLDDIKTFDTQLADSISALDQTFGQDTLTRFNQIAKQYESEQFLDGLKSGQFALERLVDFLGKTLEQTGTIAGETAGVWIKAFSETILDHKAVSAIEVFNVKSFIAKNLKGFTDLPLSLAKLFTDNVESISSGATQEQFNKQFTDFWAGWLIADKGLKEMGTDIKNTAIPDYLAGLVGFGFTVKEESIQLVTYAKALQSAGKYTTETMDTLIKDFMSTAKFKGYDKEKISGFTSSALLVGNTALDLGFTTTSKSVINLTNELMDATDAATRQANAEIDQLIISEKLTGVSRKSAIEQLVLAGKLDESKIAAASFSKALVEQQKIWLDNLNVVTYFSQMTGKSFANIGISFEDLVHGAKAFVDALGGADKAMTRLSAVLKGALGETGYLYADAVMKRKNVETNIYTKYGVNDQTVGQAVINALADPNLSAEMKANVVALGEMALASQEATRAYNENIAGLKAVTEQALTPVAGGLNAVDTSSQSFTNSMLYLAQAFGSAQAAAQSLSDSMSLVYSAQEMASKGVNIARSGFDTAAAKAGLTGLRPEDAKAGLDFIMRSYIEQGKGAEKVSFGGVSAMAEEWRKGLTDVLKPLDTATKDLVTNTVSAASTVADLGGSFADMGAAVGDGTERLNALAAAAGSLNSSLDALRTDTQKTARSSAIAKEQNKLIFSSPEMQGLFKSIGATTVEEAQNVIKQQANRTDYVAAARDENKFNAALAEPQNALVKTFWEQFLQNTVTILAPALQEADKAAQDLSAQLEQQMQNTKDLAALYKDVNKQIEEMKTSDIGKIFVDLAATIQDIVDKAADLGDTRLLMSRQTGGLLQPGDMVTNTKGGGYEITRNPNPSQYSTPLPNMDEFWTLNVNKAFESYFSSFIDKSKTAGMTETQKGLKGVLDPYAKGLKDLQEFFDKANDAVPNTFSDKQLEEAKAYLDRLKELDIAEFFKGITDSVNEEFDKIGKSDLTINLDSIATFINEELQKVVDMEAQGIPGAQAYKDKVIAVAIDRGQAATKDIYNEYLNIGATDYAKSLKEITTWSTGALASVNLIAQAWDLTNDEVIAGINAVRDSRIKALDDERKKIMEDARTAYNRTPSAMYTKSTPIAADLEGQLWGVRDSFIGTIEAVIKAGGTFTDVAGIIDIAMQTGSATVAKARDDIAAKFKQIANDIADAFSSIAVNKLRITVGDTAAQIEADRYTREKALTILNNLQGTTYEQQMQAINDLQSATMSRYDREKAAITELSDFVKNLQDYVKGLMVNSKLSTLSNQGRMQEALKQYTETFTAATSATPSDARTKARGELTSKADVYLTEAKAFYASSPQYADIFNKITSELTGITEAGKSPQEQLVSLNTDMLAELSAAKTYLEQIAGMQGAAQTAETSMIDTVIAKIRTDFIAQIGILADKLGSLEMQIKVNFIGDLTDKQLDTLTAIYSGHPQETFTATVKAVYAGELTTAEGLIVFDRFFQADPKATLSATLSSVKAGDLATADGLTLFNRMWETHPINTIKATLDLYYNDATMGLDTAVYLVDAMLGKTNGAGYVIQGAMEMNISGKLGEAKTLELIDYVFLKKPVDAVNAIVYAVGKGLWENADGLKFLNMVMDANPVLKEAVITALMNDPKSDPAAIAALKGTNFTPTATVTANLSPTSNSIATSLLTVGYTPAAVTALVNATKGMTWDTVAVTLAQNGYSPSAITALVTAGKASNWDIVAENLAKGAYSPAAVNAVVNAATGTIDPLALALARHEYTPAAVTALVNATRGMTWDTVAVTLAQNGYSPSAITALVSAGKASNWDVVAENLAKGVYSPSVVNAAVAATLSTSSDTAAKNLTTPGFSNTVTATVEAKQSTTAWNQTAADIASKPGGTTTVTANAVLTLDSVLNDSILSYGKTDVAAAYGSIITNTGNTKASVDNLINYVATSNYYLNLLTGQNNNLYSAINLITNTLGPKLDNTYYMQSGKFDSMISWLSAINNTIYTGLYYITGNTGSIDNRLGGAIKVYSDSRSGTQAFFANGGIANQASIFGEAGPEAAVPLPDGRTIPVTLSGNASNTTSDEAYAEMQAQTKELRQIRKENGQKQDAVIQRLAQLERKLAQIEANGALAGAQ